MDAQLPSSRITLSPMECRERVTAWMLANGDAATLRRLVEAGRTKRDSSDADGSVPGSVADEGEGGEQGDAGAGVQHLAAEIAASIFP